MARSFDKYAARASGRPVYSVVKVADGDSADTDIDVDGLKQGDVLLSVIQFDAGVPNDRTSEASVQANGKLQLDTTDTTGDKLLVSYLATS